MGTSYIMTREASESILQVKSKEISDIKLN